MHAKDFRFILVGQLVNMTADLHNFLMRDHLVDATLRELVVGNGDDIVVLEDVQDAQQKVPVEVVCHISTIINLARHVLEGLPRDLVILHQEVL